jgi:hypothetical protein
VASVAVGVVAAVTIAPPLLALVLGGAVMVGVYFVSAVSRSEARQLARMAR